MYQAMWKTFIRLCYFVTEYDVKQKGFVKVNKSAMTKGNLVQGTNVPNSTTIHYIICITKFLKSRHYNYYLNERTIFLSNLNDGISSIYLPPPYIYVTFVQKYNNSNL